MIEKYKRKSKLVNLSVQQHQELEKIRDEIIEKNGYATITQLIRDAIQLMIENYSEEIIQNYMPWKPEQTKKITT